MIATNEAVESFYPYIYPICLPTWWFQQTLGIPINNDDLKGSPNWFIAYQSTCVCSIYTHMIYPTRFLSQFNSLCFAEFPRAQGCSWHIKLTVAFPTELLSHDTFLKYRSIHNNSSCSQVILTNSAQILEHHTVICSVNIIISQLLEIYSPSKHGYSMISPCIISIYIPYPLRPSLRLPKEFTLEKFKSPMPFLGRAAWRHLIDKIPNKISTRWGPPDS